MNTKKKPEDMHCYRCSEPQRLHIGDELKCPHGPRRWHSGQKTNGPGKGDGCFRKHYQYDSRVGLSLSSVQAEFLDTLLTMLTRTADVSILVRSTDFADVKRVVSAARVRVRTRKTSKVAA